MGEQAAARASLTIELTLHNTRSGERSAGSKCTFHQNLTPKIKIEEPDGCIITLRSPPTCVCVCVQVKVLSQCSASK